jgi:uncharacterized damage-inducible protein DinB
MELRDHARHALVFVRRMTEGLLASCQTRGDWLHQVHPKANHALWIAGHLGLVDNSMMGRFRPQAVHKPTGWARIFWRGSQVSSESGAYPPESEVLAYFRERRERLLSVLDELSEDELRAPAPAAGEHSPLAGAPSMGHAFLFIASHESLHAGQLTVAHRALGHPPLLGS